MASKKKLNEYCQAYGLKVSYEVVSEEGPSHDPKFTVKAVIGKKEYPPAEGRAKKKAEDAAAKAALDSIEKEGKPESASNVQPSLSLLPPAPLADVIEKKPSSSRVDYISLLSQYQQKNHCMVTYSEELQSGLPHLPEFTCSCKINGKICGRGTGNSKQEAKYAAAKGAYHRLMDSENSRTEDQPSIASSTADVSSDTSESVSNFAYSLNSVDTGKTNDSSSSCQEISKNAAVKPKRGVTLAPKFSHPEIKKNKYTMNERFLKDFEGIEFIGSGGFANVFKAKHKYDEKTYAIKQVELDDKVKREVEALSNLSHENIIRYYTCWSGEDFIFDENNSSQRKCQLYSCLFIQMEFCEKGTLNHWIDKQRGKQHNQGVSLNIFKQIVKGVEYIHAKGLVHRDLKPQNIFISREDKIKIGDFGLVTSVKDEPRTKNKGTKSYMSPEQDGDTYEQEVDIYALGLIFFEILWIFPSVHEKNKLWQEIRKGTFPDAFITQFHAEKCIIDQLLSADPKKRPVASKILNLLKITSKNSVTSSHTH